MGERDSEGNLIKAPAEVQLPEVPAQWTHLLSLFFLSGQATQTGMSLAPLTWKELRAFRKENKLDLTLYERELLKKMSDAYCAESHKATDPKRPAPYVVEKEEDEVDKIALAQKFREQMQLLRNQQKKE